MEPNEKLKASRALNDTLAYGEDASKLYEKLWENKDYRLREDEINVANAVCRQVREELKKTEIILAKFKKLNQLVV